MNYHAAIRIITMKVHHNGNNLLFTGLLNVINLVSMMASTSIMIVSGNWFLVNGSSCIWRVNFLFFNLSSRNYHSLRPEKENQTCNQVDVGKN
jgi:hypothetical protein